MAETRSIEDLVNEYKSRMDTDLIKAMTAAYALIGTSDGHLDNQEIQRFFQTIKDHVALSPIVTAEFDMEFTNLVQLLTEDYEIGYQAAIDAIGRVRAREEDRKLVARMAQAAIVADSKLSEQEEATMARICELLGLEDY